MCPRHRRVWKWNTVVDQSNWKWKNIGVFGIKRICRRGRNWFPLDSSNLSWEPSYILPRWTNVSLLTIKSKTCEALLRCQSYRFIVKWIALLNRWLSCKVDSCGVWFNLSGCPVSGTKYLWSVSAGNRNSFSFSNYIPMWRCFSTLTIFKTKHIPTSTRRRHQVMCVADHKPLFRQSGETNSETSFSLEFVNVGDEQKFPKTSVCIILVDLVYLESAKIYTGPKIVRGLKRLRTTVLGRSRVSRLVVAIPAYYTCSCLLTIHIISTGTASQLLFYRTLALCRAL